MRSLRWDGLCFLLAIAVAACGGNGSSGSAATTTTTRGTTTTTAKATTTTTIAKRGETYADFNKLQLGMTEAEATAITGPCKLSSETSIGGITSKTVDCDGAEPFSTATLIFIDGKLISKSQFGLANHSSDVKGSMTLAKFNQLKIGQTPDQAQAITGPCEKTSASTIADIDSFSWTCWASDGIGSALLMFSSNKLDSKSQAGLH